MNEGTFIAKLAKHIQSHYDLTDSSIPQQKGGFLFAQRVQNKLRPDPLAAANDFHRRSRHPMERYCPR